MGVQEFDGRKETNPPTGSQNIKKEGASLKVRGERGLKI